MTKRTRCNSSVLSALRAFTLWSDSKRLERKEGRRMIIRRTQTGMKSPNLLPAPICYSNFPSSQYGQFDYFRSAERAEKSAKGVRLPVMDTVVTIKGEKNKICLVCVLCYYVILYITARFSNLHNDFVFTGNGQADVIDISSDEEKSVVADTSKGKKRQSKLEILERISYISNLE